VAFQEGRGRRGREERVGRGMGEAAEVKMEDD
jgi:hypothetical protein